MRMNIFRYIILTSILIIGVNATAQTYQWLEDKSEVTLSVELNKTKLAIEDNQSRMHGGGPMRIALLYPLELSLDTVGIRQKTGSEDLQIKKFTIGAIGSYGIIVRFKDFYIPQGAKLYVYNEINSQYAITYTNKDNPRGGRYPLEVLSGEKIIMEYVAPKDLKENPRFLIDEIGYKYKELNENSYTDSGLLKFNDASNSCMMNINCEEASNWSDQKKGVVRIRVKIGSSFFTSTGVLVNNTNKDRAPYILSAHHCFYEGVKKADMSTAEFWFNYEFPACDNETREPVANILTGADFLVDIPLDGGSDGALVKIAKEIPETWNVYFNGWDRSNGSTYFKNGAVIHHPAGDVKKISFYTSQLTSTTWTAGPTAAPDAHWLVHYSDGATAGGSSGSPIYNEQGFVVGTLTGGSSTCSSLVDPDYFGKLWYHWDKYADTDQHMQPYLDPKNSGVTQLAGMYNDGSGGDSHKQANFYAHFYDNEMTVYSRNNKMSQILVTDLSNRVLFKQRVSEINSYTISSSSSWANGVYILTVKMNNGTTSSIKILK